MQLQASYSTHCSSSTLSSSLRVAMLSCHIVYGTSVISLLVLLSSITIHVHAACYWPNQTIATDDTPCFAGRTSHCCGTNWDCLSSGVCRVQQGDRQFFYRGTCNDKSWASPDCPSFCLSQSMLISDTQPLEMLETHEFNSA